MLISVNLFSSPIVNTHVFFWNFKREFTCLPFGYSLAPRVFTKIFKPIRITLGSWANELDPCSPFSMSNSSTISNWTRVTELDLCRFHRVRFQIGLVSPSSICLKFVEFDDIVVLDYRTWLPLVFRRAWFVIEFGLLSSLALAPSSVC